jgi:hypothetical protein
MPKKSEVPSAKLYAKKYNISVLKDGKHKTINQLSLDIYEHEKTHPAKNGLFPFLKIDK